MDSAKLLRALLIAFVLVYIVSPVDAAPGLFIDDVIAALAGFKRECRYRQKTKIDPGFQKEEYGRRAFLQISHACKDEGPDEDARTREPFFNGFPDCLYPGKRTSYPPISARAEHQTVIGITPGSALLPGVCIVFVLRP